MVNYVLRPFLAFAIVASPLIVIAACSEPASHPPIVGECVGANCPPGQGQATTSGSGTGGGDGSTTVTDSGIVVDDSGDLGDGATE